MLDKFSFDDALHVGAVISLFLISTPSCASIFCWMRAKDSLGQQTDSHNYEDRDGVATAETLRMWSTKIQRVICLGASLTGLILSSNHSTLLASRADGGGAKDGWVQQAAWVRRPFGFNFEWEFFVGHH